MSRRAGAHPRPLTVIPLPHEQPSLQDQAGDVAGGHLRQRVVVEEGSGGEGSEGEEGRSGRRRSTFGHGTTGVAEGPASGCLTARAMEWMDGSATTGKGPSKLSGRAFSRRYRELRDYGVTARE